MLICKCIVCSCFDMQQNIFDDKKCACLCKFCAYNSKPSDTDPIHLSVRERTKRNDQTKQEQAKQGRESNMSDNARRRGCMASAISKEYEMAASAAISSAWKADLPSRINMPR